MNSIPPGIPSQPLKGALKKEVGQDTRGQEAEKKAEIKNVTFSEMHERPTVEGSIDSLMRELRSILMKGSRRTKHFKVQEFVTTKLIPKLMDSVYQGNVEAVRKLINLEGESEQRSRVSESQKQETDIGSQDIINRLVVGSWKQNRPELIKFLLDENIVSKEACCDAVAQGVLDGQFIERGRSSQTLRQDVSNKIDRLINEPVVESFMTSMISPPGFGARMKVGLEYFAFRNSKDEAKKLTQLATESDDRGRKFDLLKAKKECAHSPEKIVIEALIACARRNGPENETLVSFFVPDFISADNAREALRPYTNTPNFPVDAVQAISDLDKILNERIQSKQQDLLLNADNMLADAVCEDNVEFARKLIGSGIGDKESTISADQFVSTFVPYEWSHNSRISIKFLIDEKVVTKEECVQAIVFDRILKQGSLSEKEYEDLARSVANELDKLNQEPAIECFLTMMANTPPQGFGRFMSEGLQYFAHRNNIDEAKKLTRLEGLDNMTKFELHDKRRQYIEMKQKDSPRFRQEEIVAVALMVCLQKNEALFSFFVPDLISPEKIQEILEPNLGNRSHPLFDQIPKLYHKVGALLKQPSEGSSIEDSETKFSE